MQSVTPSIDRVNPDEALTRRPAQSPDVLKRHLHKRRKMMLIHAASYMLGTIALLVFSYAGAIPIVIPFAFFLSAAILLGFFTVLSETHFSDRFEDHYLTTLQVAGHVLIELSFLLAAPEIGYAFLGVMFLIFAFGSLRMTARQIGVAWTLTTFGVIPIFLFSSSPIGMAMNTPTERLAATFAFVLTIAQCAFVGLYGNFIRSALYKRSIELKDAYERIEELAELDDLTGSFNRRCIMRLLDDEVIRAQRGKSPCTIALIDLDLFKRINDVYGHPTGDEVLRTFAITMFANIRGIDKFGRYGGEEFLLVLPDTPPAMAVKMLNRLRSIVATLDWSAFSDGMTVTMSAGLATLEPHETADALLARADNALYLAKEAGRNRVASA